VKKCNKRIDKGVMKRVKKNFKEADKDTLPVEMVATKDDPIQIPEHYAYTMAQIAFLEEYKKTLDPDKAAKAAGVDRRVAATWLKKPQIEEVVVSIHKTYVKAVMLDSTIAAGQFEEVLQAFKDRFDEGDSRVSGALASMVSNKMKFTGHGGADTTGDKTQININIDLGAVTQQQGEIIDV
jgi:hypothetical protein